MLIIFHYYKWNQDKIKSNDWSTEKEEIYKKCGLAAIKKPFSKKGKKDIFTCPSCFDDF